MFGLEGKLFGNWPGFRGGGVKIGKAVAAIDEVAFEADMLPEKSERFPDEGMVALVTLTSVFLNEAKPDNQNESTCRQRHP